MPMITLPLIPTLAALGAFASMITANYDNAVNDVIASLIFAAIVYFAVYGLFTTVGL